MQPVIVTLAAVLSTMLTSPSTADESIVVFDVPASDMSESDRSTMDRYLDSPVNLRCNFVTFSNEPLLALVSNLESGATTVSGSHVELLLPDGQLLRYIGVTYEGIEHHGKNGPYLWEGKLEGNSKFFASLIIQKKSGSKAYISTAKGMYRLLPSNHGDKHFLCQRNPDFGGPKTD